MSSAVYVHYRPIAGDVSSAKTCTTSSRASPPKRGRRRLDEPRIFDSSSKREEERKFWFLNEKQQEQQTVLLGVEFSKRGGTRRRALRVQRQYVGREVAEFDWCSIKGVSRGRYGRREYRSAITETFDRARRSIRATECLYAPFAALHKLLQLRAYVIRRFAINLVPHHPSTNLSLPPPPSHSPTRPSVLAPGARVKLIVL